MSYHVHLHPLAQADYDQIFAYIVARSPDGAASWDQALDGAIVSLEGNPNIHSRIPDPVITNRDYQQILFRTKHGNTYRAVYAVDGNQVTILRIRGQGQQLLRDVDFLDD